MHGAAGIVNSVSVRTNYLPGTVRLGEVWHLPKVKLVIPSGVSAISTVQTSGSSLSLPEDTVVLLQCARSQVQAVRTVPIASTLTQAAVPRTERPFLAPCRAGRCSSYTASLMTGESGARQIGSEEDLSRLGFRAEHDREVSALDVGTTVHFLGATDLLVTFPTHALVKRTGTERPTDDPRAVRAVLLDVQTHTLKRSLDWVVDDHNDYVWSYGGNLLVHDGHVLRLYGPQLEELASLPMEVPLFSLRASPDGQHLLLGELHELHTASEHRALVESDKHGPQEEVLWSLLDGKLRRIRTLGTSSNFVPTPVLLNDGIVELRRGHEPEWVLLGRPWEGGSERRLGGLRSSCQPVLGAFSPDLLTVGLCDVSGNGMHSFLAREDGSTVMEHLSGDQDMPLSFVAASTTPVVAMLTTRASPAYTRGLIFHLSVIERQDIEVIGAERGETLARFALPEAAPYREPFALSPEGDTLALLCGQQLRLYAVGNKPSS